MRISVKNIENEKLKEKFEKILPLIREISDKKAKNDENYEFKNIIIIFLDRTRLKIVWIKMTTFFKRRLSIKL